MTDIPKNIKYDGYYWMSDQKEPKALRGEEFNNVLNPNVNPFVIEAQLFDGKTSYSVKYVDGQYIIVETDLASLNLNDGTFTKQVFFANRMGDEDVWLKFYQQWIEQEDEMCEGMKVLVPGKLIFAGFAGREDKI